MRKTIFYFMILTCFIQLHRSQNQYTIKSSVKVEGLPQEYAGFAESEKTTYMKGDKVKTETVNMMTSTTEYYDGKMVTMLMETMGNKMGFSDTPENIEKASADKEKEKEEFKPKIDKTSETKTIAGYECTKYIITIPAQPSKGDKKKGGLEKDMVITAWITDKIHAPKSYANRGRRGRGGATLNFDEIKGYPFQTEFETDAQGMKIKFIETVTEVSTDPIPDNVFVPNTEGYNIKTYKEFIESARNSGQQ